MQDGTAKPGSIAKKEQEKYYNMGSGKITAKETISSKAERKASGNDSTELLDRAKKEKKFEETDILRPGVNDYDKPDEAATEVLGSEDDTTDILRDGAQVGDDEATDVLRNDEGDDGATDVLRNDEGDDGATDVLRTDEEEDGDATDVLRTEEDGDATDILRADDDEEGTSVLTTGTLAKKVKVIYNIVVVHSDETIE